MSRTTPKLLVVDDEPSIVKACSRVLQRDMSAEVLEARTIEDAHALILREEIDVCLLDIKLPDGDGLEFMPTIRQLSPHTEIIIMTGHGGVREAVRAVKDGAHDFLHKPFEPIERVSIAATRALEKRRLWQRTRELERKSHSAFSFENIVASAPAMVRAVELAKDVAYSNSSVLVSGESGTGKELIARAIHEASPRTEKPFVALNCGALPENLIESELFGHTKGAFTGAVSDKRGLFEEADGGTLFLDEIGEMPMNAQVRLLRVLEDGQVRRVGGNTSKQVDVRVLAATNVDISQAIAEGRFREDLFYRLNVISVELPPLRDRRDDIPVLATYFLRKHAKSLGKKIEKLSDTCIELLAQHAWPGNVRQLQNAIEHAVVLCRGDSIGPQHLPRRIAGTFADANTDEPTYSEARESALRQFERRYVSNLLRQSGGNMAEAARLAGVDRSNFRKIVNRAGVDYTEFKRRLRTNRNNGRAATNPA